MLSKCLFFFCFFLFFLFFLFFYVFLFFLYLFFKFFLLVLLCFYNVVKTIIDLMFHRSQKYFTTSDNTPPNSTHLKLFVSICKTQWKMKKVCRGGGGSQMFLSYVCCCWFRIVVWNRKRLRIDWKLLLSYVCRCWFRIVVWNRKRLRID